MKFLEALLARPDVWRCPIAREVACVMTGPVVTSSAGYPYLAHPAWTRFRDWVPHILADGQRVLDAAQRVATAAEEVGATAQELENLEASRRVIRQVVLTAAITAPPQLWLLRHVLSALDRVGIRDRLLAGEAVDPDACPGLVGPELRIDLRFLLARGYLVRKGPHVRLSGHRTARRVVEEIRSLSDDDRGDVPARWARVFSGSGTAEDHALLTAPVDALTAEREPGRWAATPADIDLGFRLLSVVLGLHAAERVPALLEGEIDAATLCPAEIEVGRTALATLHAAGVVNDDGTIGLVGRRVLERGAGPFGIVAAYHPFMARLDEILRNGRGGISVRRGPNLAASQAANRRTFEKANDALDRFCAETGFTYDVFIEHAVGKGEATRQRWERAGDEPIRYFGADLEDAAIDAAEMERDAGRLPAAMRFIRNADIGQPEVVLQCLAGAGVEPEGAVMVVGNGFHEVRDQTDERMTGVFEGYERAGIVLIFTEESALTVDALLETAWNTYHAGFRYVHERSGQGLRPAVPVPPSPLEGSMPASWTECAERAGYERATAYCSRTRTIFPYTPPTGRNPAISVNHFFVPGRIARRLGLQTG